MKKQAIIMGSVNEITYSDNITETEIRNQRVQLRNIGRRARGSAEYLSNFPYKPSVIRKSEFKEYIEINRSDRLDKNLKTGSLIYIAEDNTNYSIQHISTDIDGNTLYFIDKIVKKVKADNIEQLKTNAQKRVSNWIKDMEEKKEKEEWEEMVEKEVSKMDRFWRSSRDKKGKLQ